VQGRDGWQALQRHLTAARAAADRGDRQAALGEVGAALDIDPNFLAAQTLRDRLLSDAAAARPPAGRAVQSVAAPAPIATPTPRGVSPESYAKLLQRAKQRRVETRAAAARDAIRRRQLKDAGAALDELIELDPQLPELAALTGEFDALRRRAARSHHGPWLAAAATFGATVLGATYLQESSMLASRRLIAAGVLAPAASPNFTASAEFNVAATSGNEVAVAPTVVAAIGFDRVPADVANAGAVAPAARLMPADEPVALNLPAPTIALPQAVAVPAESAVVPASVPVLAAAAVPPPRPEPLPIDESALVQKALQRYRSAYDDLDAESARAVWPAVNETALARAFDALQSQRLTFDDCDVRVAGQAATATCRGSARYVPKVGSREPRIEPRVWNLSLRKSGSSWTIDSARVDR